MELEPSGCARTSRKDHCHAAIREEYYSKQQAKLAPSVVSATSAGLLLKGQKKVSFEQMNRN
jgi:hypothetical protein